jgi:uncharacterized membrane protein
MWGITLVVAALALGLVAFSFAWGAPVLAVPVVILGAAVLGIADLRRRRQQIRQMQDHRESAKPQSVEFTTRDKETLVSE